MNCTLADDIARVGVWCSSMCYASSFLNVTVLGR
jgi:hypothetical protein